MTDHFALVLLDLRVHRHSLNALVGALETAPDLDPLELYLAGNEAGLARRLAEIAAAGKRAIVGLSATTRQFPNLSQLVRRLRKSALGGRAVWVAGGPHPTADPEAALAGGFDFVVCGEGELAFLDLLRAIVNGRDAGQIAGVASHGGESRGHRSPPVDLDAFPPFPLRRRRVVGPIEITRGCPFVCGYCQTSHLFGTTPRHRSPEVVARYAGVIRQRGLRDVRFVTPNAFAYGSADGRSINLSALEELLASVRGAIGADGRLFFGTFPSEVRPEHVQPDTLALVRRYANNRSLVIGVQSGSSSILDRCRRGHTVEEAASAVRLTAAAGLQPHVDLIFGLPGETADDRHSTLELMEQLVALGAVIHVHTFAPLPQTRFAEAPHGVIAGEIEKALRGWVGRGRVCGLGRA